VRKLRACGVTAMCVLNGLQNRRTPTAQHKHTGTATRTVSVWRGVPAREQTRAGVPPVLLRREREQLIPVPAVSVLQGSVVGGGEGFGLHWQ
jgi:hypothetical protein